MKEIKPLFDNDLNTFLSKDQIKTLENAKENIIDSFNTVTMFRTPALLRLSVLNDVTHPTPDSKYWQLKNEMYAHSIGLNELMYDIEEKLIDLDKINYELKQETERFELRRLEVKRKRIEFELVSMQKTADARIKEINNQNKLLNELKDHLEYSKTDQSEHQLHALSISQTNKVCNITEHTDIDSKNNIINVWVTCMNVLKEIKDENGMNARDNFINSLPQHQKQKLLELNLIRNIGEKQK